MRAPILLALFAVPLFLAGPLEAQPVFSLSPSTATVTVPAGASGDLTQKVKFTLINDGSLANFVVRTDQSWVTLDQESGFVDLKSSVPLSVTVVANGFDAGEYQALVTITSGDVSVTLNIILDVIGIRIAANPKTVAFSLVAGSSGSTPVAVTGVNGAIGQVVVERAAGGGWLNWTVAPITGDLPVTVTVVANTEGLAMGSYTGSLRVSCYQPTQCTAQTINVSLLVTGLSQLNINPNSLFYSTTTSAPATQSSTLTLTNTGVETAFTATVVNLPGVSVSPSSGTVRPNQPVTLTVTANPSGVTPGRYSGSIQFAGAGSTATVSVSLAITGIGVSQSTVTLSALKGRQSTTTFVITGTEPFTIQRQTGGAWLTFAPTFGVAPQTVTVTGDAATLTEGLTLGSLLVNCGTDCLAKTVNVQFNVLPFRVVSSADYKAGLAPGTIAAAFLPGKPGITTVPLSGGLLPTGGLPTDIAGVSVVVKDSASKQFQAPMFFVSPEQVNFEVPETAALGPATVTLRNASGDYVSGTFTITAVAPSLYTQDGTGTGPPAAYARYFAADGTQTYVQLAKCDAAVKCTPVPVNVLQGTAVYLELYGTGIRNHVSKNATVTIVGLVLPAAYAGAQGQFPGLDQVDVLLNASFAGKGAVTLIVTTDGIPTQPVNLVFQ